MKKIIFIIICLFLTTSLGYCQKPSQSLQLTITSDKQVYEAGESIYIYYGLKNISNLNVNFIEPFISEMNHWPAHFFIKRMNQNKIDQAGEVQQASVDNDPDAKPINIIHLPPAKSFMKKANIVNFKYYEKELSFSVSNSNLWMSNLPAGEYMITAEYNYLIPKALVDARCLKENCWQGTIASNPIIIEVKAKMK